MKEPTDADLATNSVSWPDGKSKEWNEVHAKRNRFMLCHLIPAINAAAEYFKKNHCETANYDRTFMYS